MPLADVSLPDLQTCLDTNAGLTISQEAWTNFITYFDTNCQELIPYDYDDTDILECNENILLELEISVSECESWKSDVEDFMYDIYQLPELETLITLVPELA